MCAATTAAVSGVLSKCGSIGARTRVSYRFLAERFLAGLAFAGPASLEAALFGAGDISSMRRSTSSNPFPGSVASWSLGGWGFGPFLLVGIFESLASDGLEQGIATLPVRHLAVVPTEVELGHVALQVIVTNVVESADQATLQ